MKDKVRTYYELVLGILFITCTILGYYKHIACMGEYCFISGITVGIIFGGSFIYGMRTKKKLPQVVYFSCMVAIFVIFIATLTMGLNLRGAFWFIHIINPILLFIYWLFFCNHLECSKSIMVVGACLFPVCYFIFTCSVWIITGNSPFPLSLLLEGHAVVEIALGFIALLITFVMIGFLLLFFNRWVHKKVFH